MAREEYTAMRVIAYAGLNSKMLALAETLQDKDRPIISIKDENHIFLNNKLLAAMQIREAKMARKLGISLWLLTQNLEDFANDSKRILSMMETFICLGTSPHETEQIKRFKYHA